MAIPYGQLLGEIKERIRSAAARRWGSSVEMGLA